MRLPPELRSITIRELCAALESDEFVPDRQLGSHRVYYNPQDKRRVAIPYHRPGTTLPYGTLKGIISNLGGTEEDFKRLKLL